MYVSRSAHPTPNFTNPEFQFPQFKMLQSVFSFYYSKLYWHFWVHFDINLGLLSGKNTQKVNKQNIRDSLNWVFDELNEVLDSYGTSKNGGGTFHANSYFNLILYPF